MILKEIFHFLRTNLKKKTSNMNVQFEECSQIMKNVQIDKFRTSIISIYFIKLLYGYIKLTERDTNKVSILY